MDCNNIQTGSYIGITGACGTAKTTRVSADRLVFFSPETPLGTTRSAPFNIVPGNAVLIKAYNMPVGTYININAVVVQSTRLPGGNNCNPCDMQSVYGVDGAVVFRSRMTIGDGSRCWRLVNTPDPEYTGNRLQTLIALPGTYELELQDASMLGNLQVEGTDWDYRLTPHLPARYYSGICSS